MSVYNGLALVDIDGDKDLNLTELENNLIAKRILFQKIYQLPKSRMAGCKDKLINIPINDADVINTVKSMPRTPREAGLLEISLKRKLEYRNHHKKEYINPSKIYRALNFLKLKGHPSYKFFEDITGYEERCQAEDPAGHNFVL